MLSILVFCGGVCACAGPTPNGVPDRSGPEGPSHTVYLVGHDWHAGIVIRRTDIPERVWPQHRELPAAEFLEVGWGDRRYYRTRDPHWGVALRAALLPTDAVLHLVAFDGPVAAYFPYSEIIPIKLSGQGFRRLCAHIAASYLKDDAGRTLPLGRGLYGTSLFYRSRETYHLFNNCNTWTARALQRGGCSIRPASVMQVRDLLAAARGCAAAPPPAP
jgi:uncharacterized protein (TIGR02117 family)